MRYNAVLTTSTHPTLQSSHSRYCDYPHIPHSPFPLLCPMQTPDSCSSSPFTSLSQNRVVKHTGKSNPKPPSSSPVPTHTLAAINPSPNKLPTHLNALKTPTLNKQHSLRTLSSPHTVNSSSSTVSRMAMPMVLVLELEQVEISGMRWVYGLFEVVLFGLSFYDFGLWLVAAQSLSSSSSMEALRAINTSTQLIRAMSRWCGSLDGRLERAFSGKPLYLDSDDGSLQSLCVNGTHIEMGVIICCRLSWFARLTRSITLH